MMAHKATARACLLILPLAHGAFGATAAAKAGTQDDTVLLQLGTNATMDYLTNAGSLEATSIVWATKVLNVYDPQISTSFFDVVYFKMCGSSADNFTCERKPGDSAPWIPMPDASFSMPGDSTPWNVWTCPGMTPGNLEFRSRLTLNGNSTITDEASALAATAPDCWAALAPTAPDAVSGTGDPHLSNLRGEHFDVYQPGNMALLHLPRLADPARTLLLVEADARRVGDACSVYFQVVSISGLWTNQSKPIQFLANPHVAPEGRRWKEWMRFGPIDLKVVRRTKGVDYLNVYARNIGHSGYEVGGILGLDDHAAVAKRPRECAHKHAAALWSSDAKAV